MITICDTDPLVAYLNRDDPHHHGRSKQVRPPPLTCEPVLTEVTYVLADASIVVMSERHKRCQVLTIDRKDFSVYRRNDRQAIDFRSSAEALSGNAACTAALPSPANARGAPSAAQARSSGTRREVALGRTIHEHPGRAPVRRARGPWPRRHGEPWPRA